MAVRRWSSTRAVKVWLDVVLMLGGLATLVLLVWAMAAPIVMSLEEPIPADLSVAVAIGPHSALPRMPLQFEEIGDAGGARFHRPRLVWGYGELRTETFSWRLHFVGLGFHLIALLATLWAIWNLRQVVKTALAGEPFAPANSHRLRRIGFIILTVTLVAPLIEYQLGRYLLEQLSIEGLTLSPALRFSKDWLLGGLLFLVLASIFRHGTGLEEERALTV